ncbi:hypothetical protein BK005_01575 [bacterium CG10_37_50]|nr:MAG: hypothetical protein BK005_01575 [bacterium CG10_37_50]
MKIKISYVVLSTFVLSLAVFSLASAQSNRANVNNEANERGNATSTEAKNNNASTTVRGNATSTTAKNQNASTTNNNQGNLTSENYRSAVATFVQSLLNVADKEGGIGIQVREIAKAQNDSASTTTSAIAKVENRGGFKTFLLGSDYKNLGIIRSELAITANNINKLKSLLNQTSNNEDRAELNTQIQALEIEQTEINTFVTSNESKFSLFGWFNKLFIK